MSSSNQTQSAWSIYTPSNLDIEVILVSVDKSTTHVRSAKVYSIVDFDSLYRLFVDYQMLVGSGSEVSLVKSNRVQTWTISSGDTSAGLSLSPPVLNK